MPTNRKPKKATTIRSSTPSQAKRSNSRKTHAKVRPPTEKQIERLRHYAKVFQTFLDDHLDKRPHWMEEVLCWLMEFSFKQLKRLLEEDSVAGLTWPSPVLKFHFPMPWDWEQWKAGYTDRLIQCELLTVENTRTKKSAARVISKAVVNLTTFTALHGLTNLVGTERRGKLYRPILSSSVSAKLAPLRSKHAQQEALERLFHPFSVGAASFSISDLDRKKRRFSKADLNALKQFREPEILPPITCKVNKDDYKAALSLCFQIHPFELDTARQQASFPITVGIVALPDLDGCVDPLAALEDPRLNVGTWPVRERRKFWAVLFKGLADMRAQYLGPPDEVAEELIVELKVRVRIAAKRGNQGDLANAAFGEMMQCLQEHGEVIQADFSRVGGLSSSPLADGCLLRDYLKKVDTAKDNDSRGKALEDLMASLLRTVEGFEVKQRERTMTEEIDLVIINGSNEARWKQSGPLILCECKNWSSACGKNELVQFEAKMRNRRGSCQLGFFVSWGGFGAKLEKELLRSSHDGYVVALLDADDLREAVAAGNMLHILQRSWDKAIHA